ncbi:cation:proton antiporter [Fictibacillus barbaricus]|uniref:Cell volume regulation protein A n=1 Tax=Fictibacillus barbaricus TaxID=182136 RepID=A0ABU1TWZ5_9BACL|nr:cation:proton antiporter [Fictibacillus barbaricus]MDR7071733.1 cell volume regulation protein A [Fictibacillus barbaricus]
METKVMEIVHHELLMITLVFIFGLLAIKIAEKIKIPDVALYIIIGILAGPAGLNIIVQPSDSVVYQFIIVLGSVLILFEGGRAIEISILKKVWISISLLAILGVFITAGILAYASVYLLGIPLLYALLLGSINSSTDPATLIPVFKQVHVKEKVRQTVESESAFNDATASILTFTVLGVILGETKFSASATTWKFVQEAGGGLLVGIAMGILAVLLISNYRVGIFRNHGAIVTFVTAIFSYLIAVNVNASGFMATFAAGIITGNPQILRLKISKNTNISIFHFSDTLTLLMRTLIFMFLGTQVNFNIFKNFWWQSILIVLISMFIARPLIVLICALPDRKAKWNWREIFFMFWVRETGVIPAALSAMIVASGIKHAEAIASVTFVAILMTIIIQASTTGYLAKKLGLVIKEENVNKY